MVRLYFCILVQTFLAPSCHPSLFSPQPCEEGRLLYLLHFSSERYSDNRIKGVWAFLGEEWKTAGCFQLSDKIGAACWGLSKMLVVLMMVGETEEEEKPEAENKWTIWKLWGFPCGSAGKESACCAGDLGSIPGLERSTGEGKGYPLQYSGLENYMDCIVYRANIECSTFTSSS